MSDVDPVALMQRHAYVRMAIPSVIFGSAAGDVVRVTADIARQLVAVGAAVSVPAQAFAGRPLRPGSLVVAGGGGS